MTFGEIIYNLRTQKQMSQSELAHAIGYKSRSSVAKIESGERGAPYSMVVALAEALETSPSVLLDWKDQDSCEGAVVPHIPKLRPFVKVLKSERIKTGLSQSDFASKLGLNVRTYASYERGERDLSTAMIIDICRLLNISSDVLLGISTLKKIPQFHILTDNELELIETFRELSLTQQGMIIERAHILSEGNNTSIVNK